MPPLLTIGVPVYNSMPYLREAIESLFSQTVSTFKIVAIVRDSSDGSLEYLRSIRDSRLRIIQDATPGLTHALNRMLHESDTPWLVRQDADDISYPARIETVLKSIEQFPDAGMFYSFAEYHPANSCVGTFRCTRGTPEQLRQCVKAGYLLSICHPTVVLNVSKTVAIGSYRTDLEVEDADLWWRMALQYDVRMIPEVLVGYRQSMTSLTANNLLKQCVHGIYVQYLLLSSLWNVRPKPIEAVELTLQQLVRIQDLQAKEKLRFFNICLGNKEYIRACAQFISSFLTSPGYFVRRCADEFGRKDRITNGVDPMLFLQRRTVLWP